MSRTSRTRFPVSGFTLVELLVVMAIIAVLVAILVPTIRTAMEAARANDCESHLNQIGKAALQHKTAHGSYPSGGWGPRWVGDSMRGFGEDQPGGWVFSILPYLEQTEIWHMPDDDQKDQITAKQRSNAAEMMQTTLGPVFNCPSRRDPELFPYTSSASCYNAGSVDMAARCDYAANAGGDNNTADSSSPASYQAARTYNWPDNRQHTGICFYRSNVKEVPDGTSHTIAFGEKFLAPDHYDTGEGPGDTISMYQGASKDSLRWTGSNSPLLEDTNDLDGSHSFGGPHGGQVHFVFCDGSVRTISEGFSEKEYRRLGDRADGLPTYEY